MRHGKHTFKLGRKSGHRRCLIANMLKSLFEHERIETTVAKAKELRRHADRVITMAKKGTLAHRRQAIAELMITYNPITSKEARAIKAGKEKKEDIYNNDRLVIGKLFTDLAARFAERKGGYTRILRLGQRVGDNAPTCVIELLAQ